MSEQQEERTVGAPGMLAGMGGVTAVPDVPLLSIELHMESSHTTASIWGGLTGGRPSGNCNSHT